MPHRRPRHLQKLLSKTLRFSPITGILGHRQVGKTVLSSGLCTEYVTLDLAQELSHALVDPTTFLAAHIGSPVTIDECQLAPPLFPALKEWVRINPKPRQFLLTGSVRFTSRKAIRESLTGRIITWELLPMDWAEQHEQPLQDSVLRILDSDHLNLSLKPNPTFTNASYQRYLDMGGLPGVFGARDPAIRAQRFETQINTILERDLKLLIQTSLEFRTLRKLMAALAEQVGSPLGVTELSRETGISLPTLRKLIPAFESLFLIRLIPTEGDFSKPILFFEDLGEQHHLKRDGDSDASRLLAFLYQNLRTQLHYRPDLKVEIFNFSTRAGHRMPLCFRKGRKVLGIFPLGGESELPQASQSAQSFLSRYSEAKVLFVSAEDQDRLITPQIRWVGTSRLL